MIGMRVAMALFGGLAGLGLYGLYELLEAGALPETAALALAAFTISLATGILGMWGPLRVGRASAGALAIALVSAGLLTSAGLRFGRMGDLFGDGHAVLAFFVVALIPLPFWIAGSVRDYPALFAAAWGIVMRYVGAWLFVGLVWLLIWLSDALLTIVGIDVIDRVLDIDASVWVITGLALGLAIAVANELSEIVSPLVVLRLLRVLLPVVLAVMAVFLIALPVRGFGAVFGSLSVAGTLLAMCVAAATLVTSAVDRRDEDSVRGTMAFATRVLAAILPLPAGLALWSIWLRVGEYGWTPPRLFAAVGAGMALAYGAVYLSAALRRDWRGGVRQGNIALALVLVGLAALWQTPLLDAQAISARSQAQQILVRDVNPHVFHDWGHAGDAALARLEERAAQPGQEALAARLIVAPRRATAAELADVLPVRPESETALRDRILAGMEDYQLESVQRGCARACVMVVGPFWPDSADPQAVIVSDPYGGSAAFEGFVLTQTGLESRTALGPAGPASGIVEQILQDGQRFVPTGENMLQLPGGNVTLGR